MTALPASAPATAQLDTRRLVLRALSPVRAADLVAGVADPDRPWAPDYPCEADVIAATGYLWALEHVGDIAPYGPYQLVRRSDSIIIGGAGFHGPPVDGEVEIAYAVVPSARGRGYAIEAARALVAMAGASGVRSLSAVIAADNAASRRVALAAGLVLAGSDGAFLRYTRPAGAVDDLACGMSPGPDTGSPARGPSGHPSPAKLT